MTNWNLDDTLHMDSGGFNQCVVGSTIPFFIRVHQQYQIHGQLLVLEELDFLGLLDKVYIGLQ